MNIDRKLKDWYEELKWESLERDDLGPRGNLSEARSVLERIKRFFDYLVTDTNIENVNQPLIQKVDQKLTELQQLTKNIRAFSDVSKKSEILESIKNFENNLINELGYYAMYFTKFGGAEEQPVDLVEMKNSIKDDLTKELFNDDSESVKDLKETITFASQNKDTLSVATERAKRWLETNESIVENIVSENSNDSVKKAKEHKTFYVTYVDNPILIKIPIIKHIVSFFINLFPSLKWITKQPSWHGAFGWLLGSMFFGAMVLGIIAYFIYRGEEVTVGTAILRISAIIVPSYFTLFFAQQYLNHKKLYEFYMFKDISLQTMLTLRSQFDKDSNANAKVLDKSLNVLFSEPTLSGSELKMDKVLLREMLEILRKNSN